MARSKVRHFSNYSIVDGDIRISIDLRRFDAQYQRAQYVLDGMIMESMIPFMPMVKGTFVDTTRIASASLQGSGEVYAAFGPQGRFLYEGKGMVDEKTGSPWSRRGAKKVLVSQYAGKTNAKENLSYTKTAHPKATDHWFDAAKAKDGKKWVKKAKKIAGGGERG